MAISEAELTQARTHWGEGLVAISKAHEAGDGETVRSLAEDMLDKSYGYNCLSCSNPHWRAVKAHFVLPAKGHYLTLLDGTQSSRLIQASLLKAGAR